MSNLKRYIVIDDDPLNNTICRLTIKKVLGEVDVKTFTDPRQGFEYIGEEFSRDLESEDFAVLFLDINMPVMNGWEFLERYEGLNPTVKKHIKIYILSSSVDERDVEKAHANKNIVKYLEKPITKETITVIAGQN
jgi:CheY-like chemotaxis protein